MYSSTLKFQGYDLQNVPTSTGRADMLIRVMKNALYLPNQYNVEMGFLLFPNPNFLSELAEYHNKQELSSKGFLITSKSDFFENNPFNPMSEHTMLEALYNSFIHLGEESDTSLFSTCFSLNFYEVISWLVDQGIRTFILDESGPVSTDLDEEVDSSSSKTCFIIGDQLGFSDLDRNKLRREVKPISLGKTSFLGSTTITLIKWMLWRNQN